MSKMADSSVLKMTDVEAPPDATPITINGREADPHDHYAHDASRTDHIILTLYESVTVEQYADLKDLGVELQEDLGKSTYLCFYQPPDLEPLRSLKWVRQVDVYRNTFKIPEVLLGVVNVLKNPSQGGDDDKILINVLPHHDYDVETGMQELASKVAKAAGLGPEDFEVFGNKIQLQVPAERVETIAMNEDVRFIEEVVTPVLFDDQANQLVLGPNPKPQSQELQGENQVIAVIDTGFDLGMPDDCHPAFQGRVKKLISLGRNDQDVPSAAQRYDDPNGHGTHVCGTIVGQHFKTAEGLIGGVAPNAQLVVSSMLMGGLSDSAPTPINSIDQALGVPYRDHGARIFSNSWGDSAPRGIQRPYAEAAEAIDAFIRNNPDALVIFSAGNNNPDPPRNNRAGPVLKPTIGSQAAAKNCLTVGASGTTRLAGEDRPTGLSILNPDDIYPKSSCGPTAELRMKPDVVAPGFNIFSAKSRHSAVKYSGFKTVTKDDTGEAVWQTRSGTSHATPLVAGCAAVLRELAEKTMGASPPAALLKAVIINGADKLPNISTAAQGFGRVNLLASCAMLQEPPICAKDVNAGSEIQMAHGTLIGDSLKEDEEFEMTLNLSKHTPVQGLELKVTLVYNDVEGGVVQNNLNLSVVDTLHGTAVHGYTSEKDMSVQNTVEQVILPLTVSTPKMMVRVTAQKIFPEKPQDFALAWTLSAPYAGYDKA